MTEAEKEIKRLQDRIRALQKIQADGLLTVRESMKRAKLSRTGFYRRRLVYGVHPALVTGKQSYFTPADVDRLAR